MNSAEFRIRRSRRPRSLPGWLAPVVGRVSNGLAWLEARGTSTKGRLAGWVVYLAGIAALVVYGASTNQLGTLRILTTVLMYVVLTEAWSVLGGLGGYLNFGMAMFFGVGAYTTAIVSNHWGIPPLYTFWAAGIVAGLFAVVVGIPALRLRGVYFAIVTFVLTLAVEQLVTILGITNGSLGLYLHTPDLNPRAKEQLFFFIFLGGAVLMSLVVRQISRSRFGSSLVAIREDEDAAEVLGIATTRVKTIGFVLAAVVAGMAGCVYAAQLYYIEPVATFNFSLSLNVVVGAIVGGAQGWIGPMLGAGATQYLSQQLLATTHGVEGTLVLGVLLVLFARFIPRGIVGVMKRRRGTKVTL